MKRSATSSAGLPLPPSRRRKRDRVGRVEGERERQISRLRPPTLGRVSGSRPQRTPSPLARLGPTTPQMRAAASAPRGRRRTSSGAAVATTRPAPASPGAIGYRFSCLSLGAPGERGLHCPAGAPASISPPTPHRRESHGSGAGGRQSSPGGREEEAQRPPATGRRGGKGVRARGSRQPVSRGRPPHPPLTPCPHKLRIQVQAGAPWPSRVLGTPETRRKTRHGRGHPQDPRRWRWGP